MAKKGELTRKQAEKQPARRATVNLVTPIKKIEFLEHFKDTGNVTVSARAIGTARQNVYVWINEDPDFAKSFENAKEEALDLLEKEIQRRGFEGDEKQYFDKEGNVSSIQRQYSDTLAIFFMKGNRPDKYKDRVEQENKGAVEIILRDLRAENS